MTLRTIATIAWISDVIVINDRPLVADDRKLALKVLTRMDLVDHGLEVDGFRWIVRRLTEGLIVRIGVVTKLAILHILANGSMQGNAAMASVAVVLANNEPPRDRSLVSDGKSLDYVKSHIPNVLVFAGRARLQGQHSIPFHTNCETPLGIGRNRLGKGVGNHTVGAGGLQQAFAPDLRIVGRRTSNYQIEETHLRGLNGEAGLVGNF